MNAPLLLTSRLVIQDPQKGGEAPLVRNPVTQGQTPTGGEAGTQKDGSPAGSGGPRSPLDACGTQQILMLLGMVAIFYFLLIRPQQKQEKAKRAMLAAVKVGDSVVTTGGIHGKIASLSDSTITISIDSKFMLTIDRANVGRVVTDDAEQDKA